MTNTTSEMGHLLLEFYERFGAWEHGIVAGSELSLAQMHALEMLGQMEGPTMKALAAKLGVTTGTLTAMVDRLTKMDLVVRKENPEDRRSYILALTAKGESLFNEHDGHHETLMRELAACFDAAELAQFVDYLQRIVGRI